MKIGIIPNEIKDKDFEYTEKITNKLILVGEVFFQKECIFINDAVTYLDKKRFYEVCDIIIALGGDGTLLAAAHDAAPYGKPVLGINLGRLGFLTGSESNYFYEEGYKKLAESFEVCERMMVEAEVVHKTGECEKFIALNDIVIKRAEFARMENVDVFVGNEILGTYLADGIIIATPTGTTAYSLSAGGPIADPELDAMIITPVCPHHLKTRPMVVPSKKIISVHKADDSADVSAVSADGKESCFIFGGDKVVVKKSEYKAKLVKIDGIGFYGLLAEKLK